jgi:glycosyltransferase involved in cell wall biosynthesis
VKPLSFCLLTTFYPPFNFGGDGIDVQRTARALVNRGHRVTVVHDVDAYEWLAGVKLPVQPTEQDGVEVIGLRSRLGVVSPLLVHQLGRPVVHGRQIDDIIRSRSVDVVIFNNVSLVGGPGLLSIGKGAFKIYVAHEHWLVCPTHVLWKMNREPCDERACLSCVAAYRRPPQLWRYTGALRRRLDDIDVFIARSEFSSQKHRQFGFQPAMQVLPYFVPSLQHGGADPAEPSPHPRPYFLIVSRLAGIKGVGSVLPVFRSYADADLLVIGDGDERGRLEAEAADIGNVHFLGRISNERLGPYYRHAIATIAPSAGYETFGIVLIESFQRGTPVVARRIGPFPEIVEQADAGLLYGSDEELRQALARLQGDRPYRDVLAANGIRACVDLWSEEVVIGRLLAMVEQGLDRRRA